MSLKDKKEALAKARRERLRRVREQIDQRRRAKETAASRSSSHPGNSHESEPETRTSGRARGGEPTSSDARVTVLPCVQCSTSLRLTLPLPSEFFRCPNCRHGYTVRVAGTDLLVLVVMPEPVHGGGEGRAGGPQSIPAEVLRAYVSLGLEPTQDLARIRREFRNLVAQYHPDKVAALGPDLRHLAETKMRELNTAHEVLQAFLTRRSDHA